MNNARQNAGNIVRFRRWTRKRYAVFSSVKTCVCIGVLSLSCSILTLNAQPVLFGGRMASASTADKLANEDGAALEGRLAGDAAQAAALSADTILSTVQLGEVQVQGQKRHPLPPLVPKFSALNVQDIQQAGVQNLQDLLRALPGVDIRSRGGENVQGDVLLRGGTFDQAAVLLDGVDISDPQTGHHLLNVPVPLSAVQHIELWQGAGAWPYGVAPFSGAVNLIPHPLGQRYISLSSSGGMYGYYQSEGSAQYSHKSWSLAADAGHTAADGYAPNTDFRMTQALLRLGYNLPDKFGTVKLSLGFADKQFGAQSFYSARYKEQFEKTKTFLAVLQYSKTWGSWRVEARAHWRRHLDRFDLFRYAENAASWYTGPNVHQTDVVGVGATAAYAFLRGGTTTVGVQHRYEHIFSNNLGLALSEVAAGLSQGRPVPFEKNLFFTKSGLRQTTHGFIQHNYVSRNEKWHLAAGVLLHGSSDFGVGVFGGASARYQWHSAWAWSLSAHHAYRLPTFTDLYYSSATQKGNASLKPEQAVTLETDLKWHKGAVEARLGTFYRYGFRIIDWVRQSGEEVFWASNLTRLHTVGAEASAAYTPKWPYLRRLRADYTYLFVGKSVGGASNDNGNNSANGQGGTSGSGGTQAHSLYATDYLRHSLNLSLDHGIYGDLGASWSMVLNDRAGTYLDENSVETRYKPYVLCNLRIYWQKPHYELFVTASNLFNVRYFDLGNLPQAGIWVKAGARLRW